MLAPDTLPDELLIAVVMYFDDAAGNERRRQRFDGAEKSDLRSNTCSVSADI